MFQIVFRRAGAVSVVALVFGCPQYDGLSLAHPQG